MFTTSETREEIRDGIVFCRVRDWLRGCRMVSLPFSDHCEPLVDDRKDLALLLAALRLNQEREKWKYIELRPLGSWAGGEKQPSFAAGEDFFFHVLDLQPSLDTIFRNFHKSCIQRKIHRAERENLGYEAGRSEGLLEKFYYLLLLTRRRHQLPPQPLVWFKNLRDCLGERLTIRLVSHNGQPIASILTMSFKSSLVYKYGCSDARHHNLGGMPLLFWKTIQEAKALGICELDLGRSDTENPGLVAFKEHLGAKCSKLQYFRAPLHAAERPRFAKKTDWKLRLAKRTFEWMPDSLLKLAGNLLYRHIG